MEKELLEIYDQQKEFCGSSSISNLVYLTTDNLIQCYRLTQHGGYNNKYHTKLSNIKAEIARLEPIVEKHRDLGFRNSIEVNHYNDLVNQQWEIEREYTEKYEKAETFIRAYVWVVENFGKGVFLITDEILREIQEEYHLELDSLDRYCGSVPEKNLDEIAHFVTKKDRLTDYEKADSFLGTTLILAPKNVMNGWTQEDPIVLERLWRNGRGVGYIVVSAWGAEGIDEIFVKCRALNELIYQKIILPQRQVEEQRRQAEAEKRRRQIEEQRQQRQAEERLRQIEERRQAEEQYQIALQHQAEELQCKTKLQSTIQFDLVVDRMIDRIIRLAGRLQSRLEARIIRLADRVNRMF